jgi:3-oxoacyl-[acyl-carrier-protein] synthase III
MNDRRLALVGAGCCIPPKVAVADRVQAAGVDFVPNTYFGWKNVRIAGAEDQPSAMATAAVTAALEMAGVTPDQVDLLVSTGGAHDYLPPWSVATEIMRKIGAPPTAVGFDLNTGCAGALIGIDLAQSWLTSTGRDTAVVVCSEKVTQDVALREREKNWMYWQLSDGAGAIVLRRDSGEGSLASYMKSSFHSHHAYNGLMRREFGGTRNPFAPEGENPFVTSTEVPAKEAAVRYTQLLQVAIDGLLGDIPAGSIKTVISSQLSPSFVGAMGTLRQLKGAKILKLGQEYGHVVGADVFIGVKQLLDENALSGNTVLIAVSPYLFGTALFSSP